MRKSWSLLEKIISGEKTAESRWYKTPRPPWDRIKTGDTIWFKNTGEPVTVKARITRVLQFENLTEEKTRGILEKYGNKDLGINYSSSESQVRLGEAEKRTKKLSSRRTSFARTINTEIDEYFTGKNYCVIAFFDQVEKVEPFNIDKTGYGAMCAWMCVEDIEPVKHNIK